MIAVHKHIVITVIVIWKAFPVPSTAAIARMTISIFLFRSTTNFSCFSILSTPCSSPFNIESIVTQYKPLSAFKFSLDGVVSPDSHLETACRDTFIFSAYSNCVSPLCFLNKTNFSSNFIYFPSKYITPEQRCPLISPPQNSPPGRICHLRQFQLHTFLRPCFFSNTTL